VTAVLPAHAREQYRLGQHPSTIGALHAELTGDGRNLVLIGAGNAFERSQISVRLDKLTAKWQGTGTGAVLLPATWANVVQLGYSFASTTGLAFVPHARLIDWIAAETAHRFAEPPELEPFWPPWLSPRDYQVEAARKIAHFGKFLLLDEAGVGKTLTTLLGIEQRRRTGITVFPLVILVPSWDVADVWDREIRKWMPPDWGEPCYYGGTNRTRLLRHPGVKVLITTYATARKDAALVDLPLASFAPPAVVADEAHALKNADAKQSRAARNIARRASTVVLLSGTLITRNVGDAFPPLAAMDPRTWQDKGRYASRFCITTAGDYSTEIVGLNPVTEPEFRACLLGQMLRRAKSDVLKELPPKTYSLRRPEIPPEWRRVYQDMEEEMLAELPDGTELSEMHSLSLLTRLSQLASSAASVEWTEVWSEKLQMMVPKQVVTLRAPSWKAESLLEIMAERPGQPVAVFTASRQLARITGDYLDKAGYRYGYVTGLGQGVTRRTRTTAIDAFQDGKMDAIVCTAGAGALGITLTRAATGVMIQRPWPFDWAVQPEDRLHRFGQLADKVEIIDIVSKNTVDERVRELLHTKAGRLSEFVRDRRIMVELLGGKR
jgi:SNF2 family DNA or RNA helicase